MFKVLTVFKAQPQRVTAEFSSRFMKSLQKDSKESDKHMHLQD